MNITLGTVAAVSLGAFAVAIGSCGTSSAAARTTCQVLTASQASAALGSSVTTRDMPGQITRGNSVCFYSAGGRPIAQLGIIVTATEAVASQQFKAQQQAATRHKNVAIRQKGATLISGITMNGDTQQLNLLLDAATKNVAP